MTIYLYVKTHRKTGLKYLGKTEQNPYFYQGSGVRWRKHINHHGNDVETNILRECRDYNEVREWGLYYSKLWNVVESEEWANLVEETGSGWSSDDVSKMARELWQDDEFRNERMSELHQRWSDPDFVWKMKSIQKDVQNKSETQAKRSKTLKSIQTAEYREKNKNAQLREEVVKKKSESLKEWWAVPENKAKALSKSVMTAPKNGENNPRYDQTVYTFVYVDGTKECCTRFEMQHKYNLSQSHLSMLIKGSVKTCKGWRLIK